MSKVSTALKVVGGTYITGILSYTGFVEYNRRTKYYKSPLTEDGKTLSLDAQLIDSCNTGDIVVFSRDWHKYHLVTALQILVKKFIYKTEFDHVGVIVRNKYGEPYIFETNPFGSFKLRSFHDRVHYSKASQIKVYPLLPPLQPTKNQLRNLQNTMSEIMTKRPNHRATYGNLMDHVDPGLWELFVCLQQIGLYPRINPRVPIDPKIFAKKPPFISVVDIIYGRVYFTYTNDDDDDNNVDEENDKTSNEINNAATQKKPMKVIVLDEPINIRSL